MAASKGLQPAWAARAAAMRGSWPLTVTFFPVRLVVYWSLRGQAPHIWGANTNWVALRRLWSRAGPASLVVFPTGQVTAPENCPGPAGRRVLPVEVALDLSQPGGDWAGVLDQAVPGPSSSETRSCAFDQGGGGLALERFRDSDTLILHGQNMAPLMESLMATGTVSGELLGDLSEELRAQMADSPVGLFTLYQAL